jgi:hypothetical protein
MAFPNSEFGKKQAHRYTAKIMIYCSSKSKLLPLPPTTTSIVHTSSQHTPKHTYTHLHVHTTFVILAFAEENMLDSVPCMTTDEAICKTARASKYNVLARDLLLDLARLKKDSGWKPYKKRLLMNVEIQKIIAHHSQLPFCYW